jgi:hypothetical protein
MEFIDWFFHEDSVIWTGKGQRKRDDEVYLGILSRYNRATTLPALVDEMWARHGWSSDANTLRLIVFQPKLSVPFQRIRLAGSQVFQIHQDIGYLRDNWRVFAKGVADALRRCGHHVVHVELPNWEITPQFAKLCGADGLVVPHRQHFQFQTDIPVLYYMQVFFPWMFTADRRGWGAGSSGYPFDSYTGGEAHSPVYRHYVHGILETNVSKFAQPERIGREQLEADGVIPAQDFIFFACQIPHDETIRFFSDVSLEQVVTALANWANERRIHVVFKKHPLDREKNGGLSKKIGGPYVRWAEASVHDLIANAIAVYTINSGVGVEAILHGKPVVVFGRSEYDRVAIRAEIDRLDDAWQAVQGENTEMLPDYNRFIDWLSEYYAVDLRFGSNLAARFDAIAAEMEALCGTASLPSRSAALQHAA